jgi:hypothetical protein
MDIPEELGGRQMSAQFIQMIAQGVEHGLFDVVGWRNDD